jgi:hypothetical protein
LLLKPTPSTEKSGTGAAPITRRNKVQEANDAAHDSASVRKLEHTT